jgi:hypothetical protein
VYSIRAQAFSRALTIQPVVLIVFQIPENALAYYHPDFTRDNPQGVKSMSGLNGPKQPRLAKPESLSDNESSQLSHGRFSSTDPQQGHHQESFYPAFIPGTGFGNDGGGMMTGSTFDPSSFQSPPDMMYFQQQQNQQRMIFESQRHFQQQQAYYHPSGSSMQMNAGGMYAPSTMAAASASSHHHNHHPHSQYNGMSANLPQLQNWQMHPGSQGRGYPSARGFHHGQPGDDTNSNSTPSWKRHKR